VEDLVVDDSIDLERGEPCVGCYCEQEEESSWYDVSLRFDRMKIWDTNPRRAVLCAWCLQY
jgi:hypothetical protein